MDFQLFGLVLIVNYDVELCLVQAREVVRLGDFLGIRTMTGETERKSLALLTGDL